MSRPILLEVELQGLDELREALRRLPEDLAAEARQVVENATEYTANSLKLAYPRGDTGKLREGVRTEYVESRFGLVGRVRSTSPHAHLYEFGTENRVTSKGWGRGRVLEHSGLVPISERWRKWMNGQLTDLVRQAGFEVSGAA